MSRMDGKKTHTHNTHTKRSPYLRFQEHVERDTEHFGRALRHKPKDFVVIQLEKVPKSTKLEDFRRRESSWIQRLDTLRRGYNSRREMAKRQAPLLPVYGLGFAPIKRSRNADRIAIPNLQTSNRSKDGLRRTMHLQYILQNKPDEVDEYISSLHTRTIQRILRYLTSERRGESLNELLVILKKSYLSKFPVTNVTVRRPPLLHIVGYTSALADIIPLRALYNDPSLLVHLPQGEFRDTIRTTIPAFHYGETMDRFILNGTNVGRDHDQQSTCICHLPR